MANGNDRISVSRDALRADLAELELGLRKFITEKLEGKADTQVVVSIDGRLSLLERQAVLREGPMMREIQASEKRADERVDDLDAKMTRWERGELNKPQILAFEALNMEAHEHRNERQWSLKEKVFAIVGLFVSFSGIITTIVVVAHQW